jgi:hypothetical protein
MTAKVGRSLLSCIWWWQWIVKPRPMPGHGRIAGEATRMKRTPMQK